MVAAFLTYSCMYAYRKPLSAGTFEGYMLWGIDYKVILVVTQVLGYLTAKLIGIKLISELQQKRRGLLLLALIGVAQAALFLFAVTPFPYNFVWIFFNGLPLGLIWGIVFSYIEGRKATDMLAIFLSISFIVSSGFVKSIGQGLIVNWQVSEFWMPALMGALCFPLILGSTWMLEQIPPPTAEDQASRTPRVVLNGRQRRQLLQAYLLGLVAILLANVVMTVGREVKDNFLVEIFRSLGMDNRVQVYAQTETWVGLIVLALLSLLVLVQHNKRAFFLIHTLMVLGFLAMLLATWMIANQMASPMSCIILHGVGLYTSYIVFQSVYYERFIATFKISGNVGFLIYLSDFVGYLVSCIILVVKNLVGVSVEWGGFFIQVSYAVGVLGILLTAVAGWYFSRKMNSLPA